MCLRKLWARYFEREGRIVETTTRRGRKVKSKVYVDSILMDKEQENEEFLKKFHKYDAPEVRTISNRYQ